MYTEAQNTQAPDLLDIIKRNVQIEKKQVEDLCVLVHLYTKTAKGTNLRNVSVNSKGVLKYVIESDQNDSSDLQCQLEELRGRLHDYLSELNESDQVREQLDEANRTEQALRVEKLLTRVHKASRLLTTFFNSSLKQSSSLGLLNTASRNI
jgi:hypothetical protein